MSITERIRSDRTDARRARDAGRVTALAGVLAALEDAAKSGGGTLDEQGEIAVLRRERKRRGEAAASFREGGREDDALREEGEAALIDGYLPAELSADELAAIVDAAIAETGATSPRDLGAVMKVATARAAGRADGKTLSGAVRARLQG